MTERQFKNEMLDLEYPPPIFRTSKQKKETRREIIGWFTGLMFLVTSINICVYTALFNIDKPPAKRHCYKKFPLEIPNKIKKGVSPTQGKLFETPKIDTFNVLKYSDFDIKIRL